MTYDELEEDFYKLKDENAALKAENVMLQAEVDDLIVGDMSSDMVNDAANQLHRANSNREMVETDLLHARNQISNLETRRHVDMATRHHGDPFMQIERLEHENKRLLAEVESTSGVYSESLRMPQHVVPSGHDMYQIQTIALPRTDSFHLQLENDPMTFERNYHMIAKCGDRYYRHSTRAMDEIADPQLVRNIYEQMTESFYETFVKQMMEFQNGVRNQNTHLTHGSYN